MRKPEGERGWSPIEDYRPESTVDMELYTGSDVFLPSPHSMNGTTNFAWLSFFNNDRSLYVCNLILKDYPGSYCQVQVLTKPRLKPHDYPYETFYVDEPGVEIPVDLAEEIVHQKILPYIAQLQAKMN